MLENETNPVIFSCQAVGDPVPTINWYNMVNVSDFTKYNVLVSINGLEITSSLTIMNTQSVDAGTYTCEAANFIGTVRNSGILTINGKSIHMSY